MMIRPILLLLTVVALLLVARGVMPARSDPSEPQSRGSRPGSVILFIADGAGVGHWTLASFASDDLAEMVLRFESGVVGSIHLDIFGRSYQKSMEASL